MSKILSASDILNINDLPRELVEIPEWGGSVYVRTLSGTEKDSWEVSLLRKKGRTRETDLQNLRASLSAMCMVDEQGKRLFSDHQVEALGAKSSKALDRVYDVAKRLNATTDEDLEEMIKNSGAIQPVASTSASPAS